MTVDTKYNLGDEVWGEWYMEITRFKVTSISIFVVGNRYFLPTSVVIPIAK